MVVFLLSFLLLTLSACGTLSEQNTQTSHADAVLELLLAEETERDALQKLLHEKLKPTTEIAIETTTTTVRTSTSTRSSEEQCKRDVWKDCRKYESLGYCQQEKYLTLLTQVCQTTCTKCNEKETKDCFDLYQLDEICKVWKLEGRCNDKVIGTIYCKQTCERCNDITKRGENVFNKQKVPDLNKYGGGVPIGIWGR